MTFIDTGIIECDIKGYQEQELDDDDEEINPKKKTYKSSDQDISLW